MRKSILKRKDAAFMKMVESMSILEKLSLFVIVDIVALFIDNI